MTAYKDSHRTYKHGKKNLMIAGGIAFGLFALISAGIAKYSIAERSADQFRASQQEEAGLRERMRELDRRMAADCNKTELFAPNVLVEYVEVDETGNPQKIKMPPREHCAKLVNQLLDINRKTNSRAIARLGAVWVYRTDNFVSKFAPDEIHDYFVQRNGLRFYFPEFDPGKYFRKDDPDGKLYDAFLDAALSFSRSKALPAYPQNQETQVPRTKTTETPTPAKQP